MDELRIVRGNTFHTVSTVVARTYAGEIIPDFHLADATNISVNIIRDEQKIAAQFEVTGNDIDILWKGIPKGKYGIECQGIYQGVEWRFANRFVLTIVENNAAANIPPNCIVRDDFYTIDATTLLMPVISGGGGVQSDWNESDSTDDAYIKNKPSIPTKTTDLTNDSNFVSDSDYVHTDNNYTSTEKSKLSGIASGAEVNVQSNWNETDSTADAYIANKPDIDSLKVLVVTLSAFSSLPATFYESAVTADHVCIKAELGTPTAQNGNWTVTTSAGELNISGSISGSTTSTLYLAIKQ